jgi:hypothetical protein
MIVANQLFKANKMLNAALAVRQVQVHPGNGPRGDERLMTPSHVNQLFLKTTFRPAFVEGCNRGPFLSLAQIHDHDHDHDHDYDLQLHGGHDHHPPHHAAV